MPVRSYKKMSVEDFIILSKSIHGEKYDYSLLKKEDIENNKSKITIICNECEYKWNSVIYSHINLKSECPCCVKNSKWTLKKLKRVGKEVHDNKFSYENVKEEDIIDANSKLSLKCNVCLYKWSSTNIYSHIIRKYGCPCCSKKLKWSLSRLKEIGGKIHDNKISYENIKEEDLMNTKTKIALKCNFCSYEWESSIRNHISHKTACHSCSGTLQWTIDSFLKRANEIHGEKYNYEKVEVLEVLSTKTKLQIKCNKCDYEWECSLSTHIHKNCGCPSCAGNIPTTLVKFLYKAIIHGNKFNYDNIKEHHIKNYKSIVPVICNKCGYEWSPSLKSHLNSKSGCPDCLRCAPWTYERFIKKAKLIHGNLVNYGMVEETNLNARSKVHLKCNVCNKEWICSIDCHINYNSSCPHCFKRVGYSSAQIEWLESIMEQENIVIQIATSLEKEYKIPDVGKVDGYCLENNTVYEFHGDFWHGNPKFYDQNKLHPFSQKNETYGDKYNKTMLRDEKIRNLGYNLIVKCESDK